MANNSAPHTPRPISPSTSPPPHPSPTLQFGTATGKTYRIEYTDDLRSGWQVLLDNIPGDGNPLFVTDPAATTRSQRFYRLVVVGQ